MVEEPQNDPVAPFQYILLGQTVQTLFEGTYLSYSGLVAATRQLTSLLDQLSLKAGGDVSKRLSRFAEAFQERIDQHKLMGGRNLHPEEREEVRQRTESILDAIASDATEQSVLLLHRNMASRRLQGLKSLNDTQERLVREAVRCLSCGAYRAATVMAWNAAFDYIRRWVYDDANRLNAFNGVLTQKQRRKNHVYDPISEYGEFGDLKESDVLQWMMEAQLIDGRVHRNFVTWLDERNFCAHPHELELTATEAAGNIDKLFKLLCLDPFKMT